MNGRNGKLEGKPPTVNHFHDLLVPEARGERVTREGSLLDEIPTPNQVVLAVIQTGLES